MKKDQPDLKAAYDKLDEAVRQIVSLETLADEETPSEARDGVVLDMVVIYSMKFLDEEGDPSDMVGYVSPADGDINRVKILGLLEYCRIIASKGLAE